MQLKQGTLLQGDKYRIEKVLGQGGFGITYLGEQTSLGRKVAIKEFFMKELCNRDVSSSHVSVGSEGSREMVNRFREKFLKEARNIAKLKHPNIVSVFDVFEENDTAYYVMDYCEGGSLSALLKDKYPHGMPEGLALKYIRAVASALDYIHKLYINHLDVKPANIMVDEKGKIVLIDFGLAKQYDSETGNQTSTTPVGISEGYAPMEQYRKGGVGQFSPATDIYSLGATLYKLVTGKTPPDAFVVNEEGLPAFKASESIRKAIDAAMKPRRADRIQNIASWLDLLNGKATNASKEKYYTKDKEEETKVVEPKPQPQQKKSQAPKNIDLTSAPSNLNFTMIAVIAAICMVGGFILFNNRGSKSAEKPVAEEYYKPTSSYENGHAWVDLGLSVKWATMNVGANTPSDYGDYFAWGETSTKSRYDWDNCFDCVNIQKKWSKDFSWGIYKIGGQTQITPSSGHDTARENWGGTWRMPTDAENKELCEKCRWTWSTQGGHNGYNVTGPNGNSIFLPAAGLRFRSDLVDVGEGSVYWSSTLCCSSGSDSACDLRFSSYAHSTGGCCRSYGLSVRPVTD